MRLNVQLISVFSVSGAFAELRKATVTFGMSVRITSLHIEPYTRTPGQNMLP